MIKFACGLLFGALFAVALHGYAGERQVDRDYIYTVPSDSVMHLEPIVQYVMAQCYYRDAKTGELKEITR